MTSRSTPVTLIELGTYQKDGQPMTRRDGSPIQFARVISADSSPGDLPISLPFAQGVNAEQFINGQVVVLDVHTRSEMKAVLSRNGEPFNQTVVKQRIVGIEAA